MSTRLARTALALSISAALASAAGLAQAQAQAQAPTEIPLPSQSFKAHALNRVVAGRILVVAKPGVSEVALDKILSTHGTRRMASLGRAGSHIVSTPPGAEQDLLARLKAHPGILSAELDRLVPMHFTPNDPMFGSQYAPSTVQAIGAWNTTQGKGATIAIIDTGTDATHPDLAANMVPGYNFYDDNTNTSDVHGHGTATAGTAAAVGNNGVGVSGICPQCKIMPLRISDTNGYSSYSTISAAIHYAADHGVKIANLSFGGVDSATIANAASYLRSKGGVLIMSAGNDGVNEAAFPSWDSITAVSATDSNNKLTSWSSYGTYVDLAAPGASILTTSRGGGYNYWSGTSFSSPVVAGIYALVYSANPTLSPSEMDAVVFSTAVDIGAPGKHIQYGHGLPNAAAAVAAAKKIIPDTIPPTVGFASPALGSKLAGIATLQANAADNIAVSRVELSANGSLIGTSTSAPYAFAFDTSVYPGGPITLSLKAYDAAGNMGTSSGSYTIGNDTTPPVVTITSPSPTQSLHNRIRITATATDNNRVASMSIAINGRQVAISNSGSIKYWWLAPELLGKRVHAITIVVTATDPDGNASSQSVTLQH